MKTARFLYAMLVVPGIISAFTIVLDPGHGGKFTGGIGVNNLEEKTCTLNCAQKLAELLAPENKVILTRSTDKHFHENLLDDLRLRAHYSKRYSADLFISIHYNTGGKKNRGYEIYVPYGTEFPAACYQIASYIHHELSQSVDASWAGKMGNLNDFDRGIRAARFHVLRNHDCPAILIEIDYITNKESVALLNKYQEKVVNALSRGITKFKKNSCENHAV